MQPLSCSCLALSSHKILSPKIRLTVTSSLAAQLPSTAAGRDSTTPQLIDRQAALRSLRNIRSRHYAMSTSHHPANTTAVSVQIPLHLEASLTEDELLRFPAFKSWLTTLQQSLSLQYRTSHAFHAAPYVLRSIEVQAVDRFRGNRLGFVKLKAHVTNDNGETLPGSVFLRGASVAMLIILQPDDVPEGSDSEQYAVLTVQARVPVGSLSFLELPAGMIDDGSFAGAAAKEIEEELGIQVPEDQLLNLTELALCSRSPDSIHQDMDLGSVEQLQDALYTSPGGQDEAMSIFLHRRRIPRAELKKWQGKLTGLRSEGEKITLQLVPLEDMWRVGARDAKILSAWALYEGLRREGAREIGRDINISYH